MKLPSSRLRASMTSAWVCATALAALAIACSSPQPLEITTTSLPDVPLGGMISAQIGARGGTPPYSYRATGLPAGLNISLTGGISGTAQASGRHSFTAKVYDAEGASSEREIAVRVLPESLRIVTATLAPAHQGVDYDDGLVATGGTAPFQWTKVAGMLPPGLEVTREGRVRGTPSESGNFEFTAQVEDAEAEMRTGLVHIRVAPLDPSLVVDGMPPGRVGVRYDAALHVDGGTAPFTFSITGGSTPPLPPGITLGTDGSLTGSPTVAGNFTATVRVSDASNPPRTDTAEVPLTVIAALRIRTTQLPQIVVGLTYDFTMDAIGGLQPYTWTITGDLPAGIVFDESGHFTGSTSAMREEVRLTVRVTDSAGFDEASLFTLRTTDSYVFEVRPIDLKVPRICTSTSVAYTVVEIPVLDSFQVSDVNVAVDIDYRWDESRTVHRRGNERTLGGPRVVLFAPDGTQAPLCGNGASIPAGETCSNAGQDLRKEYDDEATGSANQPERPLAVFDGMNAQGTWRLAVAISEPVCTNPGSITSVRLTIEDDRSTDDYLKVSGFRKNNMATDPFVRICSPRCGGEPENELFLQATVYGVGPNGRREGGLGDDVRQNVPLTWSWQSGGALPGITLAPNGHVTVRDSGMRRCDGAGACFGTGQKRIIVSGGGFMASMELLVFPPEWNPQVREY